MPLTTSKPTTRNTGRTIAVAKRKPGHEVIFRKWGTLANGTTLYVKTAKPTETQEMNRLLKKMGAKKMTAQEQRRLQSHLVN